MSTQAQPTASVLPSVEAVAGTDDDGHGAPLDAREAPGSDTPGTAEREPAAAPAPADAQAELLVRRAHEPRIHAVDFSQPTKFVTDLRRRILRVLTSYCEALAIRLTTELRAPVELAVGDSQQLTWSAAKAQLPAKALAIALDVQPIERSMLLAIDLPLIRHAIECLLGGSAEQAVPDRRLSEIDWALTRTLLEAVTAQLGAAWRDLGGLSLTLGEIDVEGDGTVSAPLGEATFAVTIDATIDGLPSSMSLLIPWSAVGPVASEILVTGPRAEGADPREQRAVRRGLAGARIVLRAEVGAMSMTVESMLALSPGSLLALPERAADGVQVFAERVYLGRASPGLRGPHRAIKLTTPIEPLHAAEQAPVAATHGRSALLDAGATPDGDAAPAGLARMMGVPVRVWAELGRTKLPLGSALELPPGTVLELDQGADAPIDLLVNGKRFAQGSLQVTDEGMWAVHVASLL